MLNLIRYIETTFLYLQKAEKMHLVTTAYTRMGVCLI